MPRPRFIPGRTAFFAARPRPGPPRLAVAYAAVRLGAPVAWVEPLAREGRIRVDGQTAGPRSPIDLSRAPRVAVDLPEAWPPHMARADMPLEALHEDAFVLAVDKPPGVLVHPARGHMDNRTLANAVRHRHRALAGRPGFTLGACHRLDLHTSGVVLFALRTDAYRHLCGQFAAGSVHKEYWCVVEGDPPWAGHAVRESLGPDPARPGRVMAIPAGQGGKEAETEFTKIMPLEGGCLLEARPRTGRLHQIRVHAAAMGHPILGDRDYNPLWADGRGGACAIRQALHARALAFTHPGTGQILRIEAPWPKDWPWPRPHGT